MIRFLRCCLTFVALVLLLAPAAVHAQASGETAYRTGRDQLARGVLDSAIATFVSYRAAHADGSYAAERHYWEAFARYRRNQGDDLERAAQLLVASSGASAHPDAAALAARIAALRAVPTPAPLACNASNGGVFAEILSGARTKIGGSKRVNDRVGDRATDRTSMEALARDALKTAQCPVVGRRAAVSLLGASELTISRDAVRDAVLRDAAPQVRSDALSQLVGDTALATLRVVALAARHDSTRLVALTAADVLSRLRHPATADTLMAILVDTTVASGRQQSVLSWSRLDGRTHPSLDALRQAFPRLAQRGSLGATVLEFMAFRGDARAFDWIWTQVKNPTLPTMVRLTGMQQVGAKRSVAELQALFEYDTPQLLRYGILERLTAHRDPSAARALREIIAAEPPGDMREAAKAALAAR